MSATARQALGGGYPAALRRVTTLLGGVGVSLGLVGPVADRPMVGRFLSPLGYDCLVGGCLEERQHVRLPKETRAYTTTPRGGQD